ncbi:hypothetical protein MAR_031607 [Mya arenaria]|uniref:Tyrosine-protein phosphatase domain-containing protein n=1 Tax=Mya arenaria TaxID=6604 RepID=A0ABY7F493_MYAAR|nr:hypothetical protein MAR_031607 [Mya arenaria]
MFQVSCSIKENKGYCTKRLLTVKQNDTNGRSVTHFEFNAWDNTRNIPRSAKDYLDLIRSVDANLRESSNRGPEQFEFCHECVLSCMKSFEYSKYANFTTSMSSAPDA